MGWFENGILISTVRELLNNVFTIPANAFKRGGKIKIAFAYIKDTTKIKTFPINFNVANAPEAELNFLMMVHGKHWFQILLQICLNPVLKMKLMRFLKMQGN